jgi:3-deoxy-7-phosphoheptulonate synthase
VGSPASRVVLLEPGASGPELAAVLEAAGEVLPGARVTRGDAWAAVPLGDGVRAESGAPLERLSSVRRVVPVTAPYRLASRELFGESMSIDVPLRGPEPAQGPAVSFGGRAPLGVIVSSRWASVSESRLQLLAPLLREAGVRAFHAGQVSSAPTRDVTAGLSLDALRRLRDVAHEHGLALCAEVSDAGQLDAIAEIADLLQVGSRNMQDFSLLRDMGRTDHPVLLRRGVGSTVEEFLLAAEYVLLHGNGKVILCESGIRTFDALHKPRFEINAVPLVKQLSHLPLVADPSQTAPHAGTVPSMARAAVAAGADGLVLEVGTEAVFDPEGVAIDIEAMRRLMAELRPIARAVGRSVAWDGHDGPARPADAAAVLHVTDRTLAQTIESIAGLPPDLDVIAQWRLVPPDTSWLAPPLSADGDVLARCTSYRMGSVRLSRHLSYVDLGRIDPTIGALLEATQLNLGQLFVDPRIEKLDFEFGTHEDAGEIDGAFRRLFPGELDELHPYVWRRYQAAIGGVVTFVVIEALPVAVWSRLLDTEAALSLHGGVA